MLGMLLTALFCAGMLLFALLVFRRVLEPLDPAARMGVAGLLGLGIAGAVSILAALANTVALAAVVLMCVAGIYGLVKDRSGFQCTIPKGIVVAFPIVAGLAMLISLIAVITPSSTLDWDTLAYHLAVPKMWKQAGEMYSVSFIHHSNFPAGVDGLYLYALLYDGESGAKAFQLLFFLLGMISLFGLGRQWYGERAGWWAVVAFIATPAIFWESGTGYLDVAHGLYAGLGAVFAALAWERKEYMWLSGLMLAFAAGSKYTGLQSIAAAGFLLLLFGIVRREAKLGFRSAVIVSGLALLIASPWYIRNFVWTGNPVYPFFYEKLGGRNWSDFSAAIYREEQQTFGVPRSGEGGPALALPHAVLGVAYQPGRYTNPSPALVKEPQPSGAMGAPIGAIGGVLLAAALAWMFSGRTRRPEAFILAWCGVSLLMWFVLSQQSRYIISLAPALALLLGGAVIRFRAGPILAGATAIQCAYSFWLMKVVVVDDKMETAMGWVSREQYLQSRVPFSEAAQYINSATPSGKRVALYDEVFGYFLEPPYMWANPGHSMEIPYDSMQQGTELARWLRENGFSTVYLNTRAAGPEVTQKWLGAAGVLYGRDPQGQWQVGTAAPVSYGAEERTGMMSDLRTKWRVLLAEAVASGDLVPVRAFSSGVVLQVR